MLTDTKINICEKLLYTQTLTENEKEMAVEMIEDGYLSNENNCIKVNIPALTFEQKQQFDRLAEEQFRDFMPKYVDAIKRYTDGYRKLFPKHLKNEVDRAFCLLFVGFFATVILSAQQNGLLPTPAKHSVCDVLVKFK